MEVILRRQPRSGLEMQGSFQSFGSVRLPLSGKVDLSGGDDNWDDNWDTKAIYEGDLDYDKPGPPDIPALSYFQNTQFATPM